MFSKSKFHKLRSKHKKTIKILFVAMSNSIHTARWINQITDQNWDVHIFPSTNFGAIHPELRNTVVHRMLYGRRSNKTKTTINKGIFLYLETLVVLGNTLISKIFPDYRVHKLISTVRSLKPDIIHSLEFQAAGYLISEAKKKYPGTFPKWIATNWGSDIYLFGQLKSHRKKIKKVLALCDYYSCECKRDVILAKKFGFKREILPLVPNTGGFDLEKISRYRQPGLTSQRRIIMLKGYQGWAGRALVGISALSQCINLLKDYTLIVYSSDELSGVPLAARILCEKAHMELIILPPDTLHEDILKFHGKARISIGLSMGDGISTSLLEAMVMGSFPIQSCTSAANEWIKHGKTGMIVPPEEPEIIAQAIRLALTNDKLVNNAASENQKTANQRLRYNVIKKEVIKMYKEIAKAAVD